MEAPMMSAPKSVLYGDQLPLGLEAKAQKKLFFPTTGDLYTPTGNKVIRVDVNYDGMLDTQQSFLQFKLKNTTAGIAGFDIGQPIIKKLTISSAGTILEEIQDYNTLYAGILFPSQAGDQTLGYEAMNQTGLDFEAPFTTPNAGQITAAAVASRPTNDTTTTSNVTDLTNAQLANAGSDGSGAFKTNIDAAIQASVRAGVDALREKFATAAGAGTISAGLTSYNGNFAGGSVRNQLIYSGLAVGQGAASFRGGLAQNEEVTVNYKLVSGLLDNDKYLPLVLMNAGITIEIELADAVEAMCAAAGAPNYEISGVRYVGHTIDLQRDFYDRLRMVQQGSGGVLQIVGQSFRSYRANIPALNNGTIELNCPARVRSIKSFFFGMRKNGTANAEFNVAGFGHSNLRSYQLQIGATRYPPTANTFSAASNKVGGYTELMKAFGKVGSTTHRDLLLSQYATSEGNALTNAAGNLVPFCPFGIDLESFRHQIENGIDTSSRALPIQLILDCAPTATARDVYMYVLFDTIFYINMDGSVSVST